MSDNNECDACNDGEGSMEHIFLICPAHNDQRKNMMTKIPPEVEAPFNLDSLLKSENWTVYQALFNFLQDIKHKV